MAGIRIDELETVDEADLQHVIPAMLSGQAVGITVEQIIALVGSAEIAPGTLGINLLANAPARSILARAANTDGARGDLQSGGDGRILGQISNALLFGPLSSFLDTAFGADRGSILYRGASAWARLGPGSIGHALMSGGPSGDPNWAAITGAPPVTFQVFTSSGTWNKPTGCRAVRVTVIGGGGGSDGAQGATGALCGVSGGGGAGGAAIRRMNVSEIDSVTVTVGSGGSAGSSSPGNGGNGGTTSFGSHCSATGGSRGQRDTQPSGGIAIGIGGEGGVGSNGQINIRGAPGGHGAGIDSSTAANKRAIGGDGGSSIFGGGGPGGARVGSSGTTAGSAGGNYGGGGGGSAATNGNASVGGAAGSPGVVLVEEFY